jgi:hypothetical protein
MPLPFSTCDASNVQAEDGQGADDDHPGGNVDPLSNERGEDDRECSSPEVECKLDHDARHNDVGRAADGENDAFQRASFRWGASSRLLRLLCGAAIPARLGRRTL